MEFTTLLTITIVSAVLSIVALKLGYDKFNDLLFFSGIAGIIVTIVLAEYALTVYLGDEVRFTETIVSFAGGVTAGLIVLAVHRSLDDD